MSDADETREAPLPTADALREQAYANGLRLPSRAALEELAATTGEDMLAVTARAVEAADLLRARHVDVPEPAAVLRQMFTPS